MNQHAVKSPSSAERWLNCPGCLRICAGIPRKPTGVHAMVGSIAHKIAEMCLSHNAEADRYIGMWGQYDNGRIDIIKGNAPIFPAGMNMLQIRIDAPLTSAVQIYVDEIRRKRALYPGAIYQIEGRLDMSYVVPGMFGTGDHIIIEPLVRVCVDDYKNGFGLVDVGTPENPNPQFACYGVGAVGKGNPHNIQEIELTVSQPNGKHPGGPIRSLVMTINQLRDWVVNILIPGSKRADDPNAPVIAGPWCKWCDANDPNICPAIQEEFQQTTQLTVQDMFGGGIAPTLPDPKSAHGTQLDRILKFAPLLEEWIKNCKAEAYNRLLHNSADAPTLFKLVKGSKSRSWASDEQTVVDELLKYTAEPDPLYVEPKLKTVPQVEAALKTMGLTADAVQKILSPLINIDRSTTMVPSDDPRPAADLISEMFSGENDPLAL